MGRARRVLIAMMAPVVVACGIAAVSAPAVASGPPAPDAVVHTASRTASGPQHLPYVRDGQTVPTYPYRSAVHESVFVQAPFDSDGDGKPDRIAVDIIRPRTPAGVHVPVIMDASPYYRCCGRGNESQTKSYDSQGVIASMPLFYDNYFVPRGYAVAEVDLPGTSRSTGCGDLGGPDEVAGAKAVIDWLNGRATAEDLAGNPVIASWTTGAVGMIGKSWDGSIANGVAATGVRGLKTIVPISSISSWYDYTRFGGVVREPRYVEYLDRVVGGRPGKTCDSRYAAEQRASGESTGNLNAFWAARDYRRHASKVRASVFVVHGLNDLNVTTNQFADWWSALGRRGVPRKLWLHQDGHVDPFDIRRSTWVHTLHRWFDRWLQGLHDGVMSEPAVAIQQTDGHWTSRSRWPATGHRVSLGLGGLGGRAVRTITDDPGQQEAQAVSHPARSEAHRAAFVSHALTATTRISGTPSVRLRVRVNRPTTELSARLVEYGRRRHVDYLDPGEGITTLDTRSCWGESSSVDSACYLETKQDYVTSNYDVITRGWLDAAHHRTLAHRSPLEPGRWYDITVPLAATDAVLTRHEHLGLVVTLSDEQYTSPTSTGATVRLDPTGSALVLPLAAGGVPTGASAG